MSDLVTFLLERIAEDAEQIEDARISDCPEWWMPDQWSRERALAEVEAKRAVVAEHPHLMFLTNPPRVNGCDTCKVEGWCRSLRLLALPYADHPDYRAEEWAP